MIENVVRRATDPKHMNLFVVNDGASQYIKRLTGTKREIYLGSNLTDIVQWDGPQGKYIRYEHMSRIPLDNTLAMIVFNRSDLYKGVEAYAHLHHFPIVVVDRVSAETQTLRPFLTQPTVDFNDLVSCTPTITVGSTRHITESWKSHNPYSIYTTITPPPRQFTTQPNANKILIEDLINEDYIRMYKLPEDKITRDPTEACIFLHLMHHPSELMLDCMASGVPVVTMQSPDLEMFAKERALIAIDNLNDVNAPTFTQQILNFAEQQDTVNNARKLVSQYSEQNFLNRWKRIFDYLERWVYIR